MRVLLVAFLLVAIWVAVEWLDWGWIGGSLGVFASYLLGLWYERHALWTRRTALLAVMVFWSGYLLTFTRPWRAEHPDVTFAIGVLLLVGTTTVGIYGLVMTWRRRSS